MKRSEVNAAIAHAAACFRAQGWALPPEPRWDVTDFGLGAFTRFGLVLINLAEEPEYCEKLMFALQGQKTPCHRHLRKKEDIICRYGQLTVQFWLKPHEPASAASLLVKVNGQMVELANGERVGLRAGERVTIRQGIYHEFWPEFGPAIIGEVSTANDDVNDNYFIDPAIGRFSEIEEDEPPIVRLVGERVG